MDFNLLLEINYISLIIFFYLSAETLGKICSWFPVTQSFQPNFMSMAKYTRKICFSIIFLLIQLLSMINTKPGKIISLWYFLLKNSCNFQQKCYSYMTALLRVIRNVSKHPISMKFVNYKNVYYFLILNEWKL